VDAGDDVGAGVVEDLVAALEPGEVVEQQVAAVAGILEHGAHRAVRDDDPLLEGVEEPAVERQVVHAEDVVGHCTRLPVRGLRPSPPRPQP
jgi:hypothetical protein